MSFLATSKGKLMNRTCSDASVLPSTISVNVSKSDLHTCLAAQDFPDTTPVGKRCTSVYIRLTIQRYIKNEDKYRQVSPDTNFVKLALSSNVATALSREAFIRFGFVFVYTSSFVFECASSCVRRGDRGADRRGWHGCRARAK